MYRTYTVSEVNIPRDDRNDVRFLLPWSSSRPSRYASLESLNKTLNPRVPSCLPRACGGDS